MSFDGSVVAFHLRLDKTAMLDMKGELKGHLLLHQAKLDEHDKNVIIGFACGDYSL